MNIDRILNNCQTAIKYEFRNKDHLLEAITHRTYANESKKKMKYNQRLEFLGDSVLSLIISDYLFKKYNSSKEGLLSKVKSSLVSQKSLADISKELKLGDFLLLGHGEEASGGRYRDNMLEDLFEAIVGAIYLDSGITSASKFVMRAYKERLSNLDIENFDKDYVQSLEARNFLVDEPFPAEICETKEDLERIIAESEVSGECTQEEVDRMFARWKSFFLKIRKAQSN